MGKTKCMYAIDYELSPYFSRELLQSIKICGPFDVRFDDALNKKVQKCQMDIIIRYYDNDIDKVALHHFTSLFPGYSSAKDILETFLESGNKLDIETTQQISIDGPNVN